MSALGGGVGIALALVAEEVIVTLRGGPTAIAGAAGSLAKFVDRLADPTVAGIPDLTTPNTTTPSTSPKATAPTPANPNPTNPITAPPRGSTAPVGDTPFGGGQPIFPG